MIRQFFFNVKIFEEKNSIFFSNELARYLEFKRQGIMKVATNKLPIENNFQNCNLWIFSKNTKKI